MQGTTNDAEFNDLLMLKDKDGKPLSHQPAARAAAASSSSPSEPLTHSPPAHPPSATAPIPVIQSLVTINTTKSANNNHAGFAPVVAPGGGLQHAGLYDEALGFPCPKGYAQSAEFKSREIEYDPFFGPPVRKSSGLRKPTGPPKSVSAMKNPQPQQQQQQMNPMMQQNPQQQPLIQNQHHQHQQMMMMQQQRQQYSGQHQHGSHHHHHQGQMNHHQMQMMMMQQQQHHHHMMMQQQQPQQHGHHHHAMMSPTDQQQNQCHQPPPSAAPIIVTPGAGDVAVGNEGASAVEMKEVNGSGAAVPEATNKDGEVEMTDKKSSVVSKKNDDGDDDIPLPVNPIMRAAGYETTATTAARGAAPVVAASALSADKKPGVKLSLGASRLRKAATVMKAQSGFKAQGETAAAARAFDRQAESAKSGVFDFKDTSSDSDIDAILDDGVEKAAKKSKKKAQKKLQHNPLTDSGDAPSLGDGADPVEIDPFEL